jgi:hypothetical protein
MKRSPVRLALILAFLAILGGCAKVKNYVNNVEDAPPGRIVAISLFKCNCDPLDRETVQDSFVDVFFQSTNAKPVKGENGDIKIVGIITMGEGQTGRSKGSAFGSSYNGSGAVGGSSSGSSASGAYVTGITTQVYKNGELIATHSVGQNLGSGTLISLVSLAKSSASYISKVLVRQNEIGRK